MPDDIHTLDEQEEIPSDVTSGERQPRRRRTHIDYSEKNEEDEKDISGEDSDGDQPYNPSDNEQSSEDDQQEETTAEDDASDKKKRRPKTKKDIPIDDSDCDTSEDEEKEMRREKKNIRRTRMEAERELGKSLTKEWEYQEEDEPIRRRFRKEVWQNSSRSQLMDGSENGYTKLILDKLDRGEPLTASESYLGPGVKTIENYEFGVRKLQN